MNRMSPKAKKGRVGKKKGEKKTTKTPSSVDTVNEQSKEYYVIEIQDLERRLARYERKHDELMEKNSNFQSGFDRTLQDQKEAVTVYSKTLEQRIHELADMKDRLIGLQQAKDVEKEWYERQLQQLGTEYKETKDQLISENIIIGTHLAQLDDFKLRKSELMAKLASLEEEVNGQKESHQQDIELLQKKDLLGKDRMKGQMLSRVNQVAAAFRKVSHQEMAETTKRTIRENVAIASQLGKMSDRTMEIGKETMDLKDQVSAGRQQILAMEAMETGLTRNYISSRKIHSLLEAQCQLQRKDLIQCELADDSYKELQVESDVLRESLKSCREEVVKVSLKGDRLKSELQKVQEQLKDEERTIDSVTKVISEAADNLRSALMDQHREGKNVNILEELYNLLISWKSGSESNRMEMDQTITVRTAWTAFNPSKGHVLPPIKLSGSLFSLRKPPTSQDVTEISSVDDSLATTKDACTQTGLTNKLSSLSSQLLLTGHHHHQLTLSDCEQVLLNQCKEF